MPAVREANDPLIRLADTHGRLDYFASVEASVGRSEMEIGEGADRNRAVVGRARRANREGHDGRERHEDHCPGHPYRETRRSGNAGGREFGSAGEHESLSVVLVTDATCRRRALMA
jgi:hypothetical protein